MKNFVLKLMLMVSTCQLQSCFDLYTPTYWSDDGYCVEPSPASPDCKVLSLDLGRFRRGRVDCIDFIWANDTLIIAVSGDPAIPDSSLYYFVNKELDDELLNPDEITEGPYNYETYLWRKEQLHLGEIEFEAL